MMKIALTHKGWFGVCPVYIGDLDGGAPLVVERHSLLLPLFVFSELMFGLVMRAMYICGAEPPGWPLRLTGELDGSRVIDVPDAES